MDYNLLKYKITICCLVIRPRQSPAQSRPRL